MKDSCVGYRVTVFGFTENESASVLRELQHCGTIMNYGSFAGGLHANWLHVCFSSKHEASRALLKNGEQISPTLILGVKPLDASHRSSIKANAVETPVYPAAVRSTSARRFETTDIMSMAAQPHRSSLGRIIQYVMGV